MKSFLIWAYMQVAAFTTALYELDEPPRRRTPEFVNWIMGALWPYTLPLILFEKLLDR